MKKKMWKYLLTVILPLTGVSALLGACSSMSSCNNDACYDRNVSSVDPYKKGEIASWGSEKSVAKQEEEKEASRVQRQESIMNRKLRNP